MVVPLRPAPADVLAAAAPIEAPALRDETHSTDAPVCQAPCRVRAGRSRYRPGRIALSAPSRFGHGDGRDSSRRHRHRRWRIDVSPRIPPRETSRPSRPYRNPHIERGGELSPRPSPKLAPTRLGPPSAPGKLSPIRLGTKTHQKAPNVRPSLPASGSTCQIRTSRLSPSDTLAIVRLRVLLRRIARPRCVPPAYVPPTSLPSPHTKSDPCAKHVRAPQLSRSEHEQTSRRRSPPSRRHRARTGPHWPSSRNPLGPPPLVTPNLVSAGMTLPVVDIAVNGRCG